MTLNPFLFLFVFYLFFNLLGSLFLLDEQGFLMVGGFYSVTNTSTYSALILDLLFLLFLVVCYLYFRTLGFRKGDDSFLGDGWGWAIVIHQILYIIFFQVTGSGLAGSGFSFGGSNLINYYFVAFNPDILAFIIIPLLRNKWQFWLAILILLVSFLMRGWSSGILFFLVIMMIRFYPLKITLKVFFLLSFMFLFLVLMMPLIDALKWSIRLGYPFEQLLKNIIDSYSNDQALIIYQRFIDRFYHIHNTAFIIEHLSFFQNSYQLGEFKSFWQNGLIYETICRVMDSCSMHFNRYVVNEFYDPYGARPWDVDIGSSGWIAMLGMSSIFYFLFFFSLIFLVYFYSVKYLGHKTMLVLFSFALIYLYHGWISPFINIVFYIIIFSIFYRLKFFYKG